MLKCPAISIEIASLEKKISSYLRYDVVYNS
jgi:hypothetical protein